MDFLIFVIFVIHAQFTLAKVKCVLSCLSIGNEQSSGL